MRTYTFFKIMGIALIACFLSAGCGSGFDWDRFHDSQSASGNTGQNGNGGAAVSSAGNGGSTQGNSSAPAASLAMSMAWIEPGTFAMGSPSGETGRGSDETLHLVTIARGFYMGRYAVTQEQFQSVMKINPSYFYGTGRPPATGETQARRPVEQVNWYDALAFCNTLSVRDGLTPVYSISGSTDPAVWGAAPTLNSAAWNAAVMDEAADGYRLPTEAEWEYACRAGTTTVYNLGDNWNGAWGWYGDASGNSGSKTHEVGKKLPNAWGLYDMHGNVSEWCWDWYGSYALSAGATGPSSGLYRVARGGSWSFTASGLRSAYRNSYYPSNRYTNLGFRVVRNAG